MSDFLLLILPFMYSALLSSFYGGNNSSWTYTRLIDLSKVQ
jgi:hypothetical protein